MYYDCNNSIAWTHTNGYRYQLIRGTATGYIGIYIYIYPRKNNLLKNFVFFFLKYCLFSLSQSNKKLVKADKQILVEVGAFQRKWVTLSANFR